ncbi:MAG TPA: ankyrin repeat domain-containing protein [Tepidisphaeraceae bacterium]|jgi:ankyrin repeat protein
MTDNQFASAPSSRRLPARPNLEHLKNEAKKHLKEMRRSSAATKLTDAQLAVARAYGFSSWRALKATVDSHFEPVEADKAAQEAVEAMQRAWAESYALIERRYEETGDGPRWEAVGLHSPTLKERDAEEAINRRKQLGQYRMISVWHSALIDGARKLSMRDGFRPTRALEYLPGGDALTQTTGGTWRRVDWRPGNMSLTGKPGRWDDLAEALKFLRDRATEGEYRVITVRRMIRAEQAKGRIKIVKKHAGRDTLERQQDKTAAPKTEKRVRKSEWQPIMDASFAGDVVRVRELLDAGADPNVMSTTTHRYRPLHRVIEHKKTMPKHKGHRQVIALLLERGADPKLRATHDKFTALQLAALSEPQFVNFLRRSFEPLDIFHAAALADEKRVRELLMHDRSLATARDQNDFTALHYCAASRMGAADPALAKSLARIATLLLDAGADLMAAYNWNDQWPLRPLYHACGWSNNPAVAEVLLRAGADPCDSETVYHASDEGHSECLALIENYVDPKKLATEATKCLGVQLHWRRTKGMKWLLDHGADPNALRGERKESALHIAVQNGASEGVIRTLLNHGARTDLKNGQGKTAAQLARVAGKRRLVELLSRR